MLALLRSGQNEISNLRTDANTLKKARKEVGDPWGEQKDMYTGKRCIENDEEVFTHCFKCFGEGHIVIEFPLSQGNGRGLRT